MSMTKGLIAVILTTIIGVIMMMAGFMFTENHHAIAGGLMLLMGFIITISSICFRDKEN